MQKAYPDQAQRLKRMHPLGIELARMELLHPLKSYANQKRLALLHPIRAVSDRMVKNAL